MQEKEVCWNITTNCNLNCLYCHRFLNIEELSLEENKKILNNLIKSGIKEITWSGGEPLLYQGIEELLKIASDNGIKNKIITNGILLSQNKNLENIYDYIDLLTLSMDTIDNEINEQSGRGKNNFENIKNILERAKSKDIKVNINTVVSKLNKNKIKELANFLNQYNINAWRIFKFMPLREGAIKNKDLFEISHEEFEKVKQSVEEQEGIRKIEFREEQDMEDKYVLIVANGDIIKTEEGQDVKKGNAKKDNIAQFMDESFKEKNKVNLQYKAPDLVIIGNIAYDEIDFSKVAPERKNIVEVGGAAVFSSIPASMFNRVAIVGKVGKDFEMDKFYGYNIDLSGIQQMEKPTTKFSTIWHSLDGQERTVEGNVDSEMEIGPEDIPEKLLAAKHFHITTARPEKQMEIIEYLRKNAPKATISVDTIDEFAEQPQTKEVFNQVDIAFIDKEYISLLGSNAKVRIIKAGKEGAFYYSKDKQFPIYSKIVEDEKVVDKTGAGDTLNGVFLSELLNGKSEEEALQTAVDTATESIKQKGIMNLKNIKGSQKEQNISE